MKKIVKQVVGIDVAQKELVVCLGAMYDDLKPELYAFKSFTNTAKGIKALIEWVAKLIDVALPARYVMEATGVYHEALAYFLDEHNFEVTVVLPNKISNYVRTLEIKTVTDKTASEAIARFGLERHLDQWHRPKKVFKTLRQLTRERDQVVQIRSMIKNQLHAELAGAEPNKGSVNRLKKQILFFDRQEQEIKKELNEVVKQHEDLKASVALLSSITGIATMTALIVLAETNDFELIRNKRQLTSYAGLDVKEKQSGTSIKGKPKISKRGNKYLRKAMHLPALAAIKYDERFKAIFARLVSKHGIKMKAVVAVQRKLLEMAYIIYKTKKPYDKSYLQKNEADIMNLEAV